MFAFALWDARARRLLLARDRAGKKPLYYAHLGDRLVFGSEIKALLADPAVPRDLDPTALYQYLCLGFVPHPRSIYRAIRALPPAHFLVADASGTVRVERYWQLEFAPKHPFGLHAIDEGIETLVSEAVRLRLRSDVPVGVFLSGGIDSGLVTAAAAMASDEPLRTFAVGFRGQSNPEAGCPRPSSRRRSVASRFLWPSGSAASSVRNHGAPVGSCIRPRPGGLRHGSRPSPRRAPGRPP